MLMCEADRCIRRMLKLAETSTPTPPALRTGSLGAARAPWGPWLASEAALTERLSTLLLQLGMMIAGCPVPAWMAVVIVGRAEGRFKRATAQSCTPGADPKRCTATCRSDNFSFSKIIPSKM